MQPHAITSVTKTVYDEMDHVKAALRITLDSITPDFLTSWDMNSLMSTTVDPDTPILCQILDAAAQTERGAKENKIKDGSTACHAIMTQLAKQRSNQSNYFCAPFTLCLWTNGASRQTIEALHRCGLCISFPSLFKLISNLATHCLKRASQIAQGLHIMCYDNINISTSNFVEQRSDAPAKVQSGTFAVVYEVCSGNLGQMCLTPMLQRAQQATDLHFNADIRPNCEQRQNFRSQLRIHVIDILLENCPSFAGYERTPLLQHKQRRKLPAAGHRTKQYPLRTSTIDESSITGNIAVIHDVLRTKDVNTFTKLQNLQLGFGLFHLVMNFIWALLHVHRGSINQTGSLSYFFALLDRTRLGCEHPDYHTLLATLLQILRGIILNAWTVECQYESLAQFAKSNPSPDELLLVADHILGNHAT
ncbi:hypothetical protein PAXINDRAFT_53366, partial [Paxillus involutus ATCC 200175]